MGFNHVHATELYLAALSGSQDSSLLFTKFPYAGIVKTFSKNKSITDSAAAGTALSTGVKTINGTIGMDSAMQCSLQNVAESAHAFGRPVGILSTVSIDHATPAAFYAHKPLRSSFYEIGSDLPVSGYEFFAGAGFIDPGNRKHKKGVNLFDQVIENGYTVIRGMQAYRQHPKDVDKIILLQEESCNSDCVPFAIDRKAGDLSLPEMTKEAIDFLYARNAGFFMMVEGGMIDWAAHSNDAATTFREVIDFDHAIRNAFDFYKAHPDSTLIVVTADHETGGLGIGTKRYTLDMPSLAAQANSKSYLSKAIRQLNKEASHTGNPV
ncbi:MAG: alkaline phosphatase, partial [Bacteroidales bacterium]